MGKICYVTTIAGTLSFFKNQMVYLSDNGYEVYAISSNREDYKERIGKNTTFIPVEIARGISPLTIFKSIFELKKVFKENKFDIIQYSSPNAAFVASIAAWLAGAKIRNYHLMGFRYIGEKGVLYYVLKLLEKIACSCSTHIECVSKSNLEFGVQNGIFKREKAMVVWNGSSGGINVKRFDHTYREEWRKEIRQKHNIGDDEFVFGFAGRVTRDKGINELISAFSQLNNKAKLFIIGRQEGIETLDTDLWSYAQENPNIIIVDFASDIEKYFAAFDVLVLPTYREGFGNVIIEAASVGTPAIISNIPGPIDAVIPGKTAKLVEPKNIVQLYEAMDRMMNNKALVLEMSKNAYEFAPGSFDSDKLNEKILERKNMLLGK